MAHEEDDASYDEARKLAEDALEAYAKGDSSKGDRLAKQARNTNPQAVQEVVNELEEDKNSDHETYAVSDGSGKAEKAAKR